MCISMNQSVQINAILSADCNLESAMDREINSIYRYWIDPIDNRNKLPSFYFENQIDPGYSIYKLYINRQIHMSRIYTYKKEEKLLVHMPNNVKCFWRVI